MKSVGKDSRAVQPAEEQAVLRVVIFQVEGESFGLDIFKVAEITRLMEITKVPRSLPFIEGVINLRGRIIPILNLRKRLGQPVIDYGGKGRIIIVRITGLRLGLLVDQVTKVANLPLPSIEQVPPSTLHIDADFISGVGHLDDSLIIILDLEKLLTAKEKQKLMGTKKGKA